MANDWNVDDYRMEHETIDHWELRKKFMLTHKNKFPEDKVVCLAQVFANVEFMGCRYPQQTMELVAELSRGVVEDYRHSRRSKLKRTFVAASDAAGAKVKGLKRARDHENTGGNSSDVVPNTAQKEVTHNSNSRDHFHATSSAITYGPSVAEMLQKRMDSSPSVSMPTNFINLTMSTNTSPTFSSYKSSPKTIPRSSKQPERSSDVSNFVIMRTKDRDAESNMNILQRSASASGFKLDVRSVVQDKAGNLCEIFLNEKLLVSATSETKRSAKEKAAEMVLAQLKMSCHTLLMKNILLSDNLVEKHHVLNNQQSESSAETNESELLNDSNVGNKLLKLMGWTGGGLGAKNQGITEPITVEEHVRRAGLGLSSQEAKPGPEFKRKVWTILKEYALDPYKTCNKSLVFSADFSKEERAEIHQMAQRLKLKTKSYNKKARQIVVSHKFSIQDIVAELKNSGGSNDKYELIPPTSAEVVQID